MTMPTSAATAPTPDVQITIRLQASWCARSGVKYNQCGIGPRYAPMRDALVVYCTTSPEVSATYTCSPVGHEYFHIGRSVRSAAWTVHWSTAVMASMRALPRDC